MMHELVECVPDFSASDPVIVKRMLEQLRAPRGPLAWSLKRRLQQTSNNSRGRGPGCRDFGASRDRPHCHQG